MATIWIVWLVLIVGGGGLFIYGIGAAFGGWKTGVDLLFALIFKLAFYAGCVWLVVATVNQITGN